MRKVNTVLLLASALLTAFAADTTTPVVISAASPQAGITPDSLASIFGSNISSMTQVAPVSLGVDTPIYLSFYGTGIRGASSQANVSVKIGSVTVQPTYAGPQGQTPGLDQVNVPLPLSLREAGLVNVTVTVDGATSNAVQVNVQ